MKKKLITTLLLLLVCLSGYSQISWNAKAGVNISNTINSGDVDFKPGYQFGVGMDYYFNNHWGIQPSLMLISKGYKIKGDYPPFINKSEQLKSYDITDNKRRTKMVKCLEKYGIRVQKSAFEAYIYKNKYQKKEFEYRIDIYPKFIFGKIEVQYEKIFNKTI